MLEATIVDMLARDLYAARRSRIQLEHISKAHPQMTVQDGYAIQRAWLRLELADGRTIKGRKIGLTSRAMQLASQITEPDYAPLLDDMFFENGGDVPFDRFIVPRVEVELAFLLNRPLVGPSVGLCDVLRHTEYVVPALEIIDARIEQFDRHTGAPRKVFDTIADFAANAGVVVGGRPVKPDAIDLRWIGAMLYKNAVIEETGLAAGVLNHPATGIAWLANRLATYGERLEAGDLVLAGSFTRPTSAVRGDVLHADYGTLGSIAVRFT